MNFLRFLIVLLIPFMFSISVQAEDNLLRLLPPESSLPGWKLDATPETAQGIQLYQLINGGAEIYMQSGFKRAVFASYGDAEGKIINLEIYEMASQKSAMEIHQKKISPEGRKVDIGADAVLEDYYLNFHRGPFQVTLSEYDAKQKTIPMLLDMARVVAQRIRSFYTEEK